MRYKHEKIYIVLLTSIYLILLAKLFLDGNLHGKNIYTCIAIPCTAMIWTVICNYVEKIRLWNANNNLTITITLIATYFYIYHFADYYFKLTQMGLGNFLSILIVSRLCSSIGLTDIREVTIVIYSIYLIPLMTKYQINPFLSLLLFSSGVFFVTRKMIDDLHNEPKIYDIISVILSIFAIVFEYILN